jgi:hypothetical protein
MFIALVAVPAQGRRASVITNRIEALLAILDTAQGQGIPLATDALLQLPVLALADPGASLGSAR